MRSRQRKAVLRDLVRQRIQILYNKAVEAAENRQFEYSSKLGKLIKELYTSTRVKPPKKIKKWLCKNCGIPLIPGLTARVRLRTQGRFSYIVIRCLYCGWIHRRPYKKERNLEGHKRSVERSPSQ